jgi:phospholipid N-methyltransferase
MSTPVDGDEPEGLDPRAALTRLGIAPKRHFSQNFLLDRNLARRIAELVAPEGAFAIEIGAGTGALTRPLLARCRKVLAIERDRDLVPVLGAELAGSVSAGRLEVVEADAKSFDYASVLGREASPRVVAGNLPYHLTGPLLELLVGLSSQLERAGALVQLEVAQRLAAAPGGSDYGALSVFTQAAFRVSRPCGPARSVLPAARRRFRPGRARAPCGAAGPRDPSLSRVREGRVFPTQEAAPERVGEGAPAGPGRTRSPSRRHRPRAPRGDALGQ